MVDSPGDTNSEREVSTRRMSRTASASLRSEARRVVGKRCGAVRGATSDAACGSTAAMIKSSVRCGGLCVLRITEDVGFQAVVNSSAAADLSSRINDRLAIQECLHHLTKVCWQNMLKLA